MDLSFRRFHQDDYPEYAAWFSDPELNRPLGPMDDDWLAAVLLEGDLGEMWAVFLNTEMVGVVGAVFDPNHKLPVGITEIAVKAARRRQGLAKAIFEKLLAEHQQRGLTSHMAFIRTTNRASRQLFQGLGFVAVSEPDEHGFIEYRLHPDN